MQCCLPEHRLVYTTGRISTPRDLLAVRKKLEPPNSTLTASTWVKRALLVHMYGYERIRAVETRGVVLQYAYPAYPHRCHHLGTQHTTRTAYEI